MGGADGRVDRGPASGLCGPGAGVRCAGVGETADITVKQRERLKDAGLCPRVTGYRFEVSLHPADRHIDGNGQVREGPYQSAATAAAASPKYRRHLPIWIHTSARPSRSPSALSTAAAPSYS
jgi:hypothetical protein